MLKLLDKLMTKWNRKKLIYDHNRELYLTRYYVFLKERTFFPFNIFLHKFHKSDDPVLHDHPWPFATLILKGGYYEWTPIFDDDGQLINEVAQWYGPGSLRVASSKKLHRVEIDPDIDCWTLFMPGIKHRDWGFLDESNQWVQWEEYLSRKNK